MPRRNSRRTSAVLLACLLAAGFPTIAPADESPIARGVGQNLSNFTLEDAISGRSLSLYGYRGKKAMVIVFTGVECPVGDLYMPRLAELAARYKTQGVAFLAINANAGDPADKVAAHAKAAGVSFPVLKDPGNVVADLALAERTCEALVLDGRAKVRYRGAIDDQYALSGHKGAPTANYLADAIDAVLANRPVAVPATAVAGCPIERVVPNVKVPRTVIRPASKEILAAFDEREPAVKVGSVTFASDVASILQNKCQSCHRPGQVGPFTLASYDDARRHAAGIAEVVEERKMPPWHADPRHGTFANDRSLSARERATLLAWVEQGAPLGDPAALPAPKAFPEGWTAGTPDLVFEIPEPYNVPAQGVVDYVNLRVPSNFKEDTWVQVAEARPGDRSVVHHIIVYLDDKKGTRKTENHLCGYAPGDMPSIYTPGTAKLIPAGSDFIFQIHYTPIGKKKVDRSSVGLTLAKVPVTHRAKTVGIAQRRFVIPPGADNHPVASTLTVKSDVNIVSFMPHMHLRGKSFEYKATYPDGKVETLLSVPAYDFAWQSAYNPAEPKFLPKGTRIDCLAHYDNSKGNPANPDPAKAVIWGDQTFEEMMIGYIDLVEAKPIDPPIMPSKVKTAALTEGPPVVD